MPKVILVDAISKIAAKFFNTAFGMMLSTTSYQKQLGVFTEASWVGTQVAAILVQPDGDGSIELTDLIVQAPRKNTGTILIQFIDDDANVAKILDTSVSGDAVNIAIPFSGRWQGWQGARVEFTISTASDGGSISVGYVKHKKKDSLPFSSWDARR